MIRVKNTSLIEWFNTHIKDSELRNPELKAGK